MIPALVEKEDKIVASSNHTTPVIIGKLVYIKTKNLNLNLHQNKLKIKFKKKITFNFSFRKLDNT